eukprot:GEZU01016309.1.p1 GENE.GEZU01016309.1~~GEZU01016309.1.p1  ORF type:complete len:401 (+),score=62.73 GEZU01016309.1:1-1203(+)
MTPTRTTATTTAAYPQPNTSFDNSELMASALLTPTAALRQRISKLQVSESEIQQLKNDIARIENEVLTELARLRQDNKRLEKIIKSTAAEDDLKVKKIEALQTICITAKELLNKIIEKNERYQQSIIPSSLLHSSGQVSLFREVQSAVQRHAPSGTDVNADAAAQDHQQWARVAVNNDFGLHSHIKAVAQSTDMLHMVFDAKIETVNLIRHRLKEENATLKRNVEMLQSQIEKAKQSIGHCEDENIRARNEMQQEVEQLQKLYEDNLTQLNQKLQETNAQLMQSRSYSEDMSRKLEESQKRIKELEAELSEQETARAKLANELKNQIAYSKWLLEEMEAVKLTQKFLHLYGPATVGSIRDNTTQASWDVARLVIPQDKIDLMKMLDRLLMEVCGCYYDAF